MLIAILILSILSFVTCIICLLQIIVTRNTVNEQLASVAKWLYELSTYNLHKQDDADDE